MNAYDEISPLIQESDSLRKVIIELAKQLSPVNRAKLKSFEESFRDVEKALIKIVNLHDQRQELLEQHCVPEGVTLELHEAYHDVSDDLQSETRSFFGVYKTCLNAFAVLFGAAIPEQERRGTRTKSFGSLIDSCHVISDKGPLNAIKELLVTNGAYIDKSIADYRNKMIEHSSSLSRGTLRSTPTASQIIHVDNKELDAYHTRQNLNDDQKNIQVVPIKLQAEKGYIFYYHIIRNTISNITVKSGDPIGVVGDDTQVHFGNYGPHTHAFSSLDFDGDVLQSIGRSDKTVLASPEPTTAFMELAIFCNSMFKQMNVYLNTNSDNN